jgi:hypothetical protein
MAREVSRLIAQGVVVVLSPLALGCSASISTQVSEPVRPPQPAEVAVLAIMPGTVETGSEWIRPETMHRLVAALADRYPAIEIVSPEESAQRLTDRSLAQGYASLLEDFERAGVVDPARVENVLRGVGATHFLHVQAGYFGEGLQRATPNFGGSPVFYSTKRQRLYAVARLWEFARSGPSWEAVVSSESEAGPFSRDRQPTDLVESLVLSVAERAPLGGPISADATRR